ncbi:MAG: hypothetical protein ACPGQV_03310 [Alphaproteobacteria bacterium]
MKIWAGAFEKPLHALTAVTVTPILEPVDGDDGYVRFAVFLPNRFQGLKFPTSGRPPTGEKRHDNDLTFVWCDGAHANRWEGSERRLKIRIELEWRSRRGDGR